MGSSQFIAGFAFGALPCYGLRLSGALMYLVKTESGELFQRIEAQTDSEALRRARLFGCRVTVCREDGRVVGTVNEET